LQASNTKNHAFVKIEITLCAHLSMVPYISKKFDSPLISLLINPLIPLLIAHIRMSSFLSHCQIPVWWWVNAVMAGVLFQCFA